MTFILKTTSHGDVDSGFYSDFTKLARIGDYSFEVKDLCELARRIAEDSRLKNLRIRAYSEADFWKTDEEYTNSFIETMGKGLEGFDSFMEKNRGKLSLEEKTRLIGKGIILPVEVRKDAIKIDKYDIESFYFGFMIGYLAHGGWGGWISKKDKPNFAEQTILAIQKSRNPFYKDAKQLHYFTIK